MNFWRAFGLGAGAVLGAFFYSAQMEPSALRIVRLRVKLPGLGAELRGLRLVQFSDIHMGGWMNRARLERVVRIALEQNPDVMVLTGDFISDRNLRLTVFDDLSAVLAPLAQQVNTVAVLGNHDHRHGLAEMRRVFDEAGILELRNRVLTIQKGESKLYLAGVDDVVMGKDDLEAVLAQIPAEDPAVLLAHEPDFADEAAACGRFGLQISGHTHGGQVVLPILGPLILPWLGTRYPSGLYKVGEMIQYTNRGVGMGSLAVRFNCPPEITVFILE